MKWLHPCASKRIFLWSISVENGQVTLYTFLIANVPCIIFVNTRKGGYGCSKGTSKVGWGTVEYITKIHV